MRRKFFFKLCALSPILIGASVNNTQNISLPNTALANHQNKPDRPNIIIIMSDDMGFSDVGYYGGEIETPNLDRLAKNGVNFTQFYNTARCCPTRASLLTGLYPHQTGIGHMTSDRGSDGYRGDLNNHCVTIAEVLREAGYSTYMSGKWHVTKHMGQWSGDDQTSKHNWPLQRGFDRFYGTILGAGCFYNPITLTKGNTPIQPQTKEFYYTDRISDYAVRFINEHSRNPNDQPFFGYVSYTAPHWPLHALERDIQRYEGRYDAGWDHIREERFTKMREIGLIDDQWELTERDPRVPSWDEAENKKWEARRMEVYAAQIDRMDQGIGRIIQALEQNNQLDNTMILFLHDNGGCAEVLTEGWRPALFIPDTTRQGQPVALGNNPDIMPGSAETYQSYGIPWANVSNTPFRLYKHWVHEGGISTPLIVHWPAGFQAKDLWIDEPSHLIDIMATCVDASGTQYPRQFKGENIHPMEGKSLLPVFNGEKLNREDAIYFEHEGNRAIREGKWKLVQRHQEEWELFDMDVDRSETNDLSDNYPDKVKVLKEKYQRWANRIGVLPWPPEKHIR